VKKSTGFEAQQVRSKTGIGASGACGHWHWGPAHRQDPAERL